MAYGIQWAMQPAMGGTGMAQGYVPGMPAGYGTAGYGKKSLKEQALEEMKKAAEAARAANLERREMLRTGYKQRGEAATAALQGYGTQELRDIETRWKGQMAASAQDLVSRGLSGSSLSATMPMGYQREMSADLARARDRQTQMRLGYQTGLEQDRLQQLEREEDVYPEYGGLMKLLEEYGQAGGEEGAGGMQPGIIGMTSGIRHANVGGGKSEGGMKLNREYVQGRTPYETELNRAKAIADKITYEKAAPGEGRSFSLSRPKGEVTWGMGGGINPSGGGWTTETWKAPKPYGTTMTPEQRTMMGGMAATPRGMQGGMTQEEIEALRKRLQQGQGPLQTDPFAAYTHLPSQYYRA